ncbi:hypothetical protein C6Y62_05695 [Hyphomicrobium sulfonivorans]|nr:hypothetical protein [Hyphomicrobium sulfonivorans]NSL71299.1 hypothetical protein [Hyphomicrobium sulfonivorans]
MPPRVTCIDPGPAVVLREVVAHPGHPAAAVSFGLALASQRLSQLSRPANFLWVREAAAAVETGEPCGSGLAGFAFAPDSLIVARLRTHVDALRAALEGARCQALGAVVLETIRPVDLTASRRLKLAAEKSGVLVVLIQLAGIPMANAAQLRWTTRTVTETGPHDADQQLVFDVTVLKHPAGQVGQRSRVRWDHDQRCFTEALPVSMATISGGGSLAA